MAPRAGGPPPLRMTFCDRRGKVFDHPALAMAGANGATWLRVPLHETIPLPEGSTLVVMPGRQAVGWDPASGRFQPVERVNGIGVVYAAAAVLPPAYLRTLLPASRAACRVPREGRARLRPSLLVEGGAAQPELRPPGSRVTRHASRMLPLLGYTALGWAEGGFRVAALRLDRRRRWDPVHFGTAELPALIAAKRRQLRGNRIVEQIARCAIEYHCYTAQNFFYGRWEAGIPVSPQCNARCVGCISLQPSACCPSPQERIDVEPTVDEIAAVAAAHLADAKDPMVSFGQGCEGEPLLRAEAIAEAVARVRRATSRGTVHINTNGSRPEAIERLAKAGVGSLRVSLASCDPIRYDAYHRPGGYNLWDVGELIDRARKQGLRVALNVLALPGVTDTESEIRHLLAFLRRHPVDAVQLRNLNLDPDGCLAVMVPSGPGIGIRRLLRRLRAELPGVPLESFNRPRG